MHVAQHALVAFVLRKITQLALIGHGAAVAQMVMADHRNAPVRKEAGKFVIAADVFLHPVYELDDRADVAFRFPAIAVQGGLSVR